MVLLMSAAVVGLVTCLMIVGRTTPDIIVVDDGGQPIANATIVGTSQSIQGQKTSTNGKGYASIPRALQPTEWIEVEKPGYVKSGQVSARQTKPIRVTLKKEPPSGTSGANRP
jgi:hypothetical protein